MLHHGVYLLILVFLFGCQVQSRTERCNLLDFSTEKTQLSARDLTYLQNPPYSNHDRQEAVSRYFSQACPKIQLQPIDNHSGQNVICRIAGRQKKRILVGAHFDRIGSGSGVADNWTGIVLVNRLITELSKGQLNYTWEVIAFGAEESRLKGSRTYVKHAVRDQEISNIVAMINIDTLGLGSLKVDRRSNGMLKCLVEHLADDSGIKSSQILLPGITGDWEPFMLKGIPVLSIHSLDRRSIKIVHTRKDSLRSISIDRLEEAWRILFNLQRYLDQLRTL